MNQFKSYHEMWDHMSNNLPFGTLEETYYVQVINAHGTTVTTVVIACSRIAVVMITV